MEPDEHLVHTKIIYNINPRGFVSGINGDITRPALSPIFCLAVDMTLQPNEGNAVAIKKFGAQEIHTPQELLKKIDKKQITIDTYQLSKEFFSLKYSRSKSNVIRSLIG